MFEIFNVRLPAHCENWSFVQWKSRVVLLDFWWLDFVKKVNREEKKITKKNFEVSEKKIGLVFNTFSRFVS